MTGAPADLTVVHEAGLGAPLHLEGGGVLERPRLAYATAGTLDGEASNAVLLCHSFTHDAVAWGTGQDGRAGWWQALVGPGKALDTDRFFVVCSNAIGGCGGSTGPASVDPRTGVPYGGDFPIVTPADMADAQARLMDRLGVARLAALIGGCMGAMQVLEWARRHPERVERAVAISIGPATSAHSLALWKVMRRLIQSDPAWRGGHYYGSDGPRQGLGLSNEVAILLWMGRLQMAERYGRAPSGEALRFTLEEDFAIEELLAGVHASTSERFDPNSFLFLSRAMDYFDLERGYDSLEEAVSAIAADVTLVSYRGDWRYPPDETQTLCDALVASGCRAEHHVLDSAWSHGAFLYDPATLVPVLVSALARRRA
jgi:homoserine O-acetyltransferase